VGIFVTSPLVLVTMMYAYEDIFGGFTPTPSPAPLGVGPSGTEVRPGIPPQPSRFGGGPSKWPAPVLGVAAVVLLAAVIFFSALVVHQRSIARHERENAEQQAREAANTPDAADAGEKSKAPREVLAARLEAATGITDVTAKDKLLAALVSDAANAGEADLVKDTLGQMFDTSERTQTAHEAVRLLAARGLRKQALEIAKAIADVDVRNQALTELAQ
jgi:hypothetical protein